LASVLRQRRQFPEGTRVNVIHHVEQSGDGSNDLPAGVRESLCTIIGGSGTSSQPFCRQSDRGDVALIDDIRLALPPVQGDAVDQLLAQGIAVDQSTNTHHRQPTLRSRFSATAVILLPTSSKRAAIDTSALDSSSVRFVLRNEDCGAAVLLLTPAEQRASGQNPLAISIPPHSCAAWRWANEGERLIQSDDSDTRICRGGVEGGIVQCGGDDNSQIADAATCVNAGGLCGDAPRVAGVPYKNIQRHFACKVCYTEADCANEPTCKQHECCRYEILYYYRYPTPGLVYAGQQLNMPAAILGSPTTEKK
jgi:hypothetical protein